MLNLLTQGLNAPDIALLSERIALGAFFSISGFHKAFNHERRETLRQTFMQDGVTSPAFMYLIPAGELFGGLGILVGFLTVPAALGLALICGGASLLDGSKRICAFGRPIDRADFFDDILYLPEVLYALIMVTIMLTGPGVYSLDHIIFNH